jgi:CO/xanthine dehydrogenase Mo-binding subunit
MESHMDELARSLKLDPLEFRLQNAAGSGDLMSNGNPWPKPRTERVSHYTQGE